MTNKENMELPEILRKLKIDTDNGIAKLTDQLEKLKELNKKIQQ